MPDSPSSLLTVRQVAVTLGVPARKARLIAREIGVALGPRTLRVSPLALSLWLAKHPALATTPTREEP